MLSKFYDTEDADQVLEELGVETYLCWDRPHRGILAVGKIDRAYLRHDGVLVIVDYKCGSRVPTEAALKRDPQAAIYRSIAAQFRSAMELSGIEIVFRYLMTGAVVVAHYQPMEFKAAWTVIEAIAAAIKTAKFEASIGLPLEAAFEPTPGSACIYCSVRRQCSYGSVRPSSVDASGVA